MSGLVVRPGFAIVWDELIYDQKLSDKAVRLYAALWRHGSAQGTACPSVARLAQLLGCSDDKVQRAKKELVDAGYITVEKRYLQGAHANGSRQSDIIRLFLPTRNSAVPLGRNSAGYPGRNSAGAKAVDVQENETGDEPQGSGAPPPLASPSLAHHVKEWVPRKHEPIPEDERARIRAAMKARR